MNNRRLIALSLIFTVIIFVLGGCFKKAPSEPKTTQVQAELVYYKLFDDEDAVKPIIDQYMQNNPGVKIVYKKFTDLEEYENLIINELAEGEGPDIFSIPNYWALRHARKISPAPTDFISPVSFEDTFVSVAKKDLVFTDPRDGIEKVFGLPMAIDTLALYYNKSAYEDKIPSRGKPPLTWDELQEDVYKLTKKDNSFERFEVAGVALGRSDNISRAVDILYLMMLQYKASFYNENISRADFSKQKSDIATGQSLNPATSALNLFTSFALPANKNYSWNAYLANASSQEKELETFAKGKVVMIFGYSYLYDQILDKIQELAKKGVNTINTADVRVAPVPQVIDPTSSTVKRDSYASYYAETVSRTSEYPDVAWDFLAFMASKENMAFYNEKTHKPSSRRDLIEDQLADPIYGVYAEQIGYAESLPIYDNDKYNEIFGRAIDSVLATITPEDAIKVAEDEINAILPSEGLITPRVENPVMGAEST